MHFAAPAKVCRGAVWGERVGVRGEIHTEIQSLYIRILLTNHADEERAASQRYNRVECHNQTCNRLFRLVVPDLECILVMMGASNLCTSEHRTANMLAHTTRKTHATYLPSIYDSNLSPNSLRALDWSDGAMESVVIFSEWIDYSLNKWTTGIRVFVETSIVHANLY